MLRLSWSLPFSFPVRVMLTVASAITLTAPTAHAQVRITEVLADPPGADAGNQRVEITNLGDTLADIGGWRICVQFVYRTFPSPLTLDPGETYVIHVRADGASDDNNFFTNSAFPALIASDDSFGLYLSTGSFGSSSAISDYVGWGAGGQPRENVAVGAGIWSAGDFVPLPAEGQSIQLCDKDAHSSADWLAGEVSIGSENLACNTVSVRTAAPLSPGSGGQHPTPRWGAPPSPSSSPPPPECGQPSSMPVAGWSRIWVSGSMPPVPPPWSGTAEVLAAGGWAPVITGSGFTPVVSRGSGERPGRLWPGWSVSAQGVSPPSDPRRRWENPAPHGVSLAGPPAGRPRSARGDG